MPASEIVGLGIVNDQDESLGSVNDLILMTENQQVYVVLASGGFLGIGEKWTLFPLADFEMGDGELILRGFTSEQISQLPDFDPAAIQHRSLDFLGENALATELG